MLDKLLGNNPGSSASTDQSITEQDLKLDFDFDGLSLREFATSSHMQGDHATKPAMQKKDCMYCHAANATHG